MHISGADASAAQVVNLLKKSPLPSELNNRQANAVVNKNAELKPVSLPHENGKGQRIDIRA